MNKLGKRIMVLALAGILGATSPALLPNMKVTTVADAATVKLSKTKLNLKVGETKTLKMTGVKGKVTWTTSNKSVATVSKSGKVVAKKAGNATITAKYNKKNYTCKVTVADGVKKMTIGSLQFEIPASAVTETNSANGIEILGIGLNKKDDLPSIIICDLDYTGKNVSPDAWLDNLKTIYSEEQQQATVKKMYSDGNLDNFTCNEVKSKYDKMMELTMDVKDGDKVMMRRNTIDIYQNEHWYEIVISESETESKAFNKIKTMFLSTYKIVK